MNLNLPKYNCTYFSLEGECVLTKDDDDALCALMARTHAHNYPDGSPRIALFGSKFTAEDVADKVEGALFRVRDEDTLTCRLDVTSERVSTSLRRPPRDYRPVALLIDSISTVMGPLHVDCHAVFEYTNTGDYVSKVPLPTPLIFPDGDGGATHTEGVEFSRRTGDELEYRVFVSNSERRDLFSHVIHFETTLELNRASVRRLRDRARSISTKFLAQKEDN